jgi:uncharacterized protein with von Willebrand factor type A (vWA) domain
MIKMLDSSLSLFPIPGTCLLLQDENIITPVCINISPSLLTHEISLNLAEIQDAISAIINLALVRPGVIHAPSYSLFYQRSPASVAYDYAFTLYGREVVCSDKICFFIETPDKIDASDQSMDEQTHDWLMDTRDALVVRKGEESDEDQEMVNERDEEGYVKISGLDKVKESEDGEDLVDADQVMVTGSENEDDPVDMVIDDKELAQSEDVSEYSSEVEVQLTIQQKTVLLQKMGIDPLSKDLPARIVIPRPSIFGVIKSWFA